MVEKISMVVSVILMFIICAALLRGLRGAATEKPRGGVITPHDVKRFANPELSPDTCPFCGAGIWSGSGAVGRCPVCGADEVPQGGSPDAYFLGSEKYESLRAGGSLLREASLTRNAANPNSFN